MAMQGEPSAEADQSPTHSFDAAQGSNLIENINSAVLGFDNGL